MTCNLCYGYERMWKDTSNKDLRGAYCTENKIDTNALPHCLIAQPINDQLTVHDLSDEAREHWEKELQIRYQMMLSSHGEANE